MTLQRTFSPVDDRLFVERTLADEAAIDATLERAAEAAAGWRETPVQRRVEIIGRAIDHMAALRDELAAETTWQMGRPIAQTPGEIRGLEERARYMLAIAPGALADRRPELKAGFTRFIRHEPLGLVFVIAPWNYPYLTAVNSSSRLWPPATSCCSSTRRRHPCAPSASSRRSMPRGFPRACSSICT